MASKLSEFVEVVFHGLRHDGRDDAPRVRQRRRRRDLTYLAAEFRALTEGAR
jgi:hypothetical protein